MVQGPNTLKVFEMEVIADQKGVNPLDAIPDEF